MFKKILSLFIVLSLILIIAPSEFEKVIAAGDQNIRVRIEGNSDTLFDKEITVTNEVYAYDVLVTALGEVNIEGISSDYGFYITGLLGEKAEGNTYWGLYTGENGVIEPAPAGISSLRVEDIGSELLLHITDMSNWPSLTYIPNVIINSMGSQYEIIVKDANGPIEGVNIDVSYIGVFKTDKDGKTIFAAGKGPHDVFISKDGEFPAIIRQYLRIKGDGSSKIQNTIEDLKGYYKKDGQYSFREAIALNHTSININDLKDIQRKFKINEQQSASAYAGNIMGLIASGYDAGNYNGKNYVRMLADTQRENGKFIVESWDDYPTTIAYSILAMDMVQAQYNIESAVNALISFESSGNFGSVDDTAMAIMALANHKDITGVTSVIDRSIRYIQSQQLSTGGFEAWGAENPYSIAAVIQALVANDINPLSEEWTKNGNTLLDALLRFKNDDHFEYISSYGTDINSATEQAFTALADLYRGRSMYKSIKSFIIDEKPSFTVTSLGSNAFYKGQEARVELKINNSSAITKEVTLIVTLYDKVQNRMLNYTYLTHTLDAGETETIAGGLLIPDSGEFEVRVFLWDNMQDMNILADPIIFAVR